jgi:hypothetical protein
MGRLSFITALAATFAMLLVVQAGPSFRNYHTHSSCKLKKDWEGAWDLAFATFRDVVKRIDVAHDDEHFQSSVELSFHIPNENWPTDTEERLKIKGSINFDVKRLC